MSDKIKRDTIPYSKTERQAETAIDHFLHSVTTPSALTVLEQLRNMS